jgi:hypothetical protein
MIHNNKFWFYSCINWLDFEIQARKLEQKPIQAINSYQTVLKSFFPKHVPLQHCTYTIISAPVTVRIIEAMGDQKPLGWCDDLVRTQTVPSGKFIAWQRASRVCEEINR